MKKLFLVLRHEFWRHVKRRGFIFMAVGFPLLMAVVMGSIILFFVGKAREPMGVVDRSGTLLAAETYRSLDEDALPIDKFSDESSARSALERGDIQAYVVVPPDYVDTGNVTLYHRGDAFDGLESALSTYLRTSLLAGSQPLLVERFSHGPDVTFVSLAPEEGRDNPLTVFLPFLVGFIFLIAIFTTSGYLIQAVVDEKENRTMEILVTSLTPGQLMGGKILGLVGLGLVQIAVWTGFVVIALTVARLTLDQFPALEIPAGFMAIATLWFLPFYLMIAALMTAVGISVTAVSEGQQAVSILSIVSMFPLYFTFLIVESPNSPLAVTLSLIPFSAPLTILSRLQVTEVPPAQLLLSWLILAGSAALALFLVSRLLRAGMLRYGRRLSWREMVATLRK
jgi:ABC-2 type transport system permease protein